MLLTLRKSVEVDSQRQEQEQERTASARLRDVQQKQISMLNATVAGLHAQLQQYQQQEGDVVSIVTITGCAREGVLLWRS